MLCIWIAMLWWWPLWRGDLLLTPIQMLREWHAWLLQIMQFGTTEPLYRRTTSYSKLSIILRIALALLGLKRLSRSTTAT
jgi:hypothetical protein